MGIIGGVLVLDIYLVRHGATLWNKMGIWQGQRDVELDEEGISQAKATAERFKNMEIDGMYTSVLQRAIKTAEIINQYHNLQIKKDPDLSECDIGNWDGKKLEEILLNYKEQLEYWHKDIWAVVDGVEALGDVQRRAVRAIKRIVKEHNLEDKIVVVAHGLAIRTIISWILNIPLNQHTSFRVDNTSVSHVIYEGDYRYILASLNETWHLEYYGLETYLTPEEKEID
jgi:probable phosphoglycerate mutase